jgi:hypothetical protein
VVSSASHAIALSAGTPTQLTFHTQPPTIATSGQAFGTQPVLLLRDAANNPVSGTVVTATITGAPAGISLTGTTTATTDGSGLATFADLGLSGTAGNYTLTFTAGALTSPASNGIALGAGIGTQLTYNTQPSTTATSGAAFLTQPVLLLRDASNNPVGSAVVTATITGAPIGASLIGSATATTNASGVATFSGLGLSALVGNYTLTFTAGAATSAASNQIAVSAGTPTQLTFDTQPSTTASTGVPFTMQPVLLLRDAANNPISGVDVTAAITGSPAGVSFVGTTTVTTNGSGQAVFSGLGLSGPGGNYTLTFSAGSVFSTASNTIALGSGTATQLTYNTQPSTTAQSGATFAIQPVLLLRDAGNNPVGGESVTATITGSPAGASLVGTATVTTDGAGLATFADLGISALAGNYTLTFTSGAVTSVASNTIALSAGAPTQLTYNTQPSTTAASGIAFGTQPVLLLRDSGNNLLGGVTITATITDAAPGVALIGSTTAVTNGSGVATFAGLGLSGTVGNYTLTFTAGALSSPPSNVIALGPGAANRLAIGTQPVGGASGDPLGTQPVILIQDAQSNTVTGDNVTQVSVAITSGAGGALGGTQSVTAVNGIATFTDVTLTGTVGEDYLLTFTAVPALTSVTSGNVNVAAGGASQLTYNTQPAGAVNDIAFTTQPVILVRDAGNNAVAGVDVTATITGTPAGVVLIGTTTVTSDGSGLATFSGLGLRGLVGSYTLTFTSNGGALSSAASDPISLTVGAPAIISANSATSQSAPNSAAVSAPPSVKVTDTGTNPVSGVAVAFAVTAGGGTVVPADPATVSTGIDGVATATSWTLGPTIGTDNNSVTATATGLSGSPVTFTASATVGSPSQLSFFTAPGVAATNDVVISPQPVVLVRDAGNNNVAGAVVTASISGSPAGVALQGTLFATAAANGRATFTDLELVGLAGNYALTFTTSAGTLDSDPIALSAGAAAIITANSITTQSAEVGTTVAAPPSVKVTDTGLNPIAGVEVTFVVSAGGGTVVPAGPTTVTTLADGTATATSWTLGNTAGTENNTVTAAAAGLSGSPVEFKATGTAGTATQLTYDTQPSGTATSGVAFAQQPALLLRDIHNNPVEGQSVTATITGAPAGVALIGTVTLVTNASGQVVFSGLGLSGSAGTYTLTFTALGGTLLSPASVDIVLSP